MPLDISIKYDKLQIMYDFTTKSLPRSFDIDGTQYNIGLIEFLGILWILIYHTSEQNLFQDYLNGDTRWFLNEIKQLALPI